MREFSGTAWRGITCLLCVLLFSAASAAQTEAELRSRYGDPESEEFMARPDVRMSVKFGKNLAVCEIGISSNYSAAKPSRPEYLSTRLANEIVDELVPESSRGEQKSERIFQFGPRKSRTLVYPNLEINYEVGTADYLTPENNIISIGIWRTRFDPACRKSASTPEH